ncbi:hypothetical protein [Amycolatopsis anabasis]|uniref:hypothetical protein n=1 Tax=Amycolatopsis anabasis TaxID=1840409 RepID=UPI0031B60910
MQRSLRAPPATTWPFSASSPRSAPTAAPNVRMLRARESSLDGNDWPAYADGEPFGSVPVSARCVPDALSVVA